MKLTSALLLCLFSTAFASTPTVSIYGVPHVLVSKDKRTGEEFDSDNGYCVLRGFKYSAGAGSRNMMEGPYVVLDAKGAVVKTYPVSEDNLVNLRVLVDIWCEN